MEEIVLGSQPHENIHIGQSEIRIQEDDPFSHGLEMIGQVDGYIGLAHASFAGGD